MSLWIPRRPETKTVAGPDEGQKVRGMGQAPRMGLEIRLLVWGISPGGQNILHAEIPVPVQHRGDVFWPKPVASKIGKGLEALLVEQLLYEIV